MKKTILAAGLLAIMTGAVAGAANLKPIDYRRTLFAPVGQDMLMLEAPMGMCFLDTSRYTENAIFKMMAAMESKKGKGVLLGVFAPCNGIANIGNGDNDDGVMSSGSVVWLNPSVGEKTPLERADYLDMREPTYKDEVRKGISSELSFKKEEDKKKEDDAAIVQSYNVDDYAFDDAVRRTQDGLWIGFTHDIDVDYEKVQAISVAATTSLRHYPLEIVLHINSNKYDYNLEQTHELMDKFLAQQVALNE